MAKKFFGFAVADSMFPSGNRIIKRVDLTAEQVRDMAEKGELTPCLNPSHKPTIEAARSRFGIMVEVPEKAPQVQLEEGDSLIVMSTGTSLPRLQGRHEYTEEEIAAATFNFSMYTVLTDDQVAQRLGFADAHAAWAAMMQS